MNEKTAELRDIFLDVAEDETVTESQEELRGSVTEGQSDEEVRSVIEEMREKFDFETDLSTDRLESLVALFYDDYDDETVASELSVSASRVFEARMDLHLVRADDPPGVTTDDTVWESLRDRRGEDPVVLADSLPLDADQIQSVQAVIETENRSRRVSHRFRTAFEERLTDIDLRHQHAADAQRDGLDDATEDAEVDVDF